MQQEWCTGQGWDAEQRFKDVSGHQKMWVPFLCGALSLAGGWALTKAALSQLGTIQCGLPMGSQPPSGILLLQCGVSRWFLHLPGPHGQQGHSCLSLGWESQLWFLEQILLFFLKALGSAGLFLTCPHPPSLLAAIFLHSNFFLPSSLCYPRSAATSDGLDLGQQWVHPRASWEWGKLLETPEITPVASHYWNLTMLNQIGPEFPALPSP